eukprot:Opistho-1_new@85697
MSMTGGQVAPAGAKAVSPVPQVVVAGTTDHAMDGRTGDSQMQGSLKPVSELDDGGAEAMMECFDPNALFADAKASTDGDAFAAVAQDGMPASDIFDAVLGSGENMLVDGHLGDFLDIKGEFDPSLWLDFPR